MLPGDAEFEMSEFHLYAEGFDSFCPVYSLPLEPGQLHPSRANLATTLPPRASYDATWVSSGAPSVSLVHDGSWG